MEFGIPDRQFVRESRAFDYVYDHVYTPSSRKDFCIAASLGSRAASEIKLRPIYKSMFSELKRDRRLEACLVDKQPCLTQNFLPPLDTERSVSADFRIREVEPTGADRAIFALKYAATVDYKFARPIPSFDMEEEIRRAKKSATSSGAFHVTRGQQSIYRESETQTDPYSPPYQLQHADSYPRVLALLNLTWGKGLPPTMDDIVTIERALTRRLAEMAKVSVDDDNESELLKHSKVMEELEAHIWAEREKELFRIMEQKREIMKRLRHELQIKVANMDSLKLERVFDHQKKKNAIILGHIRQKYLRELRKLEKTYCKTQIGSRVEATLSDNGYGSNSNSRYRGVDSLRKRHAPEYDFQLANDYELFEKLTSSDSFKRNHLEFNCKEFTKCIIGTKQTNREHRTEKMLDEAFSAFRAETLKKPEPSASKLINRILKGQIRRVPTPAVEGPPIEEEMATNAVVLLQKVIRGRAVQTMIRDEIRANASTLADMKALHGMDPNGLKATFGEIASIQMMQQEREAQIEKEIEISEITDQLEGETLGQQLEFLEKEMIRLQDERKIHCLLMLAERERRMKEAIEAGRRQHEEDARRANDEIFRQVVGIHQSTVDVYLEDMYLNTLERTADAISRAHVQNLASTLNEATYLAQKNSIDESEELTADIVHSFLMPEMNRIYQRQKMETLNNRYIQASSQVATSMCTAQGVVREIIDSLHTTIPTHLDIGEAAVDATQITVDQIIKDAVGKAFNLSTEPAVTEMAEIPGEDGNLPETVQLEVDVTEPMTSIKMVSEKIPVEVPCLEIELGIKSIELETGTEVGVDAINLLIAAKHVTCSVFEEAERVVQSCFEETEGEDEELDSGDDDADGNNY